MLKSTDMKIIIQSPTKALIERATQEEIELLRGMLTYTNTANAHLLKRHSQNKWFMVQNRDAWDIRYDELQKKVKQTVLLEENGQLFIRPGSIPYIQGAFALEIENNIQYPTIKKVAWAKPLPFELHPYQQTSVDKLIEAKHGNVELCTGSGKSIILLKICRESGLKTAIVAPSKSIFNELVEKFEYHLGKGAVGKFGDGKKKLDKRFTICIGDSLANIEKDTEEWNFFNKLDMICIDESHTWGASTLETVCHGVFSEIPYRFFFSGTQTRGDGAKTLLQSIVGPTANTLSTKEAVEGGYISPHRYRIIELESSNPNMMISDPLEMKRIHFLRNKNIAAFVTKLVKATSTTYQQQTLVLVEELSQICALKRLLDVENITVAYAHSESKKERLEELGLEKVNPSESVEKFNKGEVSVLIGTSCIATGTNIYPVHNCVNWVGGTSEIKTKQGAVGRSIRLGKQNKWNDKCTEKKEATIYDFDVSDIHLMSKHLEDRVEFYKESGSEIKYIKLKK